LSTVRVFRIGGGMGLKARMGALFKVAAVLSGMTLARSSFVFRSTNVAIEAFLPALFIVELFRNLSF
jgi:hypothetical protein